MTHPRLRRGPRTGPILRPLFVDLPEATHQESDAVRRRRRVVVAVTLVAGAILLGLSLAVEPGDARFYYLTFALAGLWVAGALASGPLHLGRLLLRGRRRRPIAPPIGVGLAIAAVFVAGALVVREIEPLRDVVVRVLDHASEGSLPLIALITIVNGVAEEMFFRGALFAAVGTRHAVLASSVAYVLATAATGNVMLVFAAVVLSPILGLQRRSTGGVLAPVLTHITWSTAMVLALPPLFAAA